MMTPTSGSALMLDSSHAARSRAGMSIAYAPLRIPGAVEDVVDHVTGPGGSRVPPGPVTQCLRLAAVALTEPVAAGAGTAVLAGEVDPLDHPAEAVEARVVASAAEQDERPDIVTVGAHDILDEQRVQLAARAGERHVAEDRAGLGRADRREARVEVTGIFERPPHEESARGSALAGEAQVIVQVHPADRTGLLQQVAAERDRAVIAGVEHLID